MTDEFEKVWNQITSKLRAGTDLRNWGAARGYTGGSFRVDDVERTSITVSGGDMQMTRRISRGDFEKVCAVWDDYRAGNLPRTKLSPVSRNTTYILSILHMLDT